MTLFSYKAIDNDGKEVQGTIDAPNRAGAERALDDLHLEITDLHEASRAGSSNVHVAPPPQLKTSFVFEGTDPSGAVRKGTIQAINKYEAFNKLRQEHALTLSLLTPMGVKAPEYDTDLDEWQPAVKAPDANPAATPPTNGPITPVKPTPSRSVSFTVPPSKTPAPVPPSPKSTPVPPGNKKIYFPLSATLRLYAGWLLAWYGLFVALGYYAQERALPFQLPFVQSFFVSPTIFSVTVAVFLFLLLSTMHAAIKGKTASGLAMTAGGIAGFLAIRMAA